MQSEKAVETGELLAQVDEKILTTTIKEITAFGVKLELNLAGQVAGGLYTGQHLETVNMYQKMDGTSETEARSLETTAEGDVLVLSFKGKGRATGISTVSAESEAVIMTKSTRLTQLNNMRIRTEITGDFATGVVRCKYFKL
jgi:hypothetical protein